MTFNDSKIFNNHLFSLPSRNCKWYPYFNQKEFLEVVMQRTAFLAELISSAYSFSELGALEKIYDSDFYDELEHIESDTYCISLYWSHYQICQELGLKPFDNIEEVCNNCKKIQTSWLRYLVYTIEYLKLFLVNDNGLSPSGWNILQHLNRIGITQALPDNYCSLQEKKITAIKHAESIAKHFSMGEFKFCEPVENHPEPGLS